MRTLTSAFAAFMLALAVTASAVPLSGGAITGSSIVGTLADANNPVEMATAPEYTRLAVLRQRTTKLLLSLAADRAVSRAQLQVAVGIGASVQAVADEARRLLDGAGDDKIMTPAIADAIADAREAIARGEYLYDSLRGMLK